jgi:DNA-directed RNA polymerase specialized sigma24 family protein
MGVDAEAVSDATVVSLRQALEQCTGQTQPVLSVSCETLDGIALERVVSPLLAAACRAAREQWQAQQTGTGSATASSAVRSQGEMLALELLADLDEMKRLSVLLADMEGFSTPEIAAVTEVRLDVVYEELRKARKALARALGRHDSRQESHPACGDPETQARELLEHARSCFTPDTTSLAAVIAALSARV